MRRKRKSRRRYSDAHEENVKISQGRVKKKSMAARQLIFGEDARRALQRGMSGVADAVKVTPGPRGRNVMLDKNRGSRIITKDGVTVASEIALEDAAGNPGAQLVKAVDALKSRAISIRNDPAKVASVAPQTPSGAGLD